MFEFAIILLVAGQSVWAYPGEPGQAQHGDPTDNYYQYSAPLDHQLQPMSEHQQQARYFESNPTQLMHQSAGGPSMMQLQQSEMQPPMPQLRRSLSMPLTGERRTFETQAGDFDQDRKSLLANSQAKKNKVSSLMHFIHRKSQAMTFAAPKAVAANAQATVEPDYSRMYDDQVLMSLCPKFMGSVCAKAIERALQKSPQELEAIVDSIRNKPAHVNANRLLLHRLMELTIRSVESKGYDEKLDKAIDFVATKNPYTFAASQAVNLVSKGK